jgi:hypothetical protein
MSGDLKWNKIIGAGLATAFVIIGVQQVTGAIYHTETPEKMGYFVDAPEEAAGGPAEAVLPPDWGTVLPAADLAAGGLFRRAARPATPPSPAAPTASAPICSAWSADRSCTAPASPIPTP